jgi:seryl-tRNA synthetase
MALVQYALSIARKRGWQFMIPPSVVRQEYTAACGFKPRDQNNEQQVYMMERSDYQADDYGGCLCLTGTAEIPIAGWGANKTLSDLPIKKVGLSRSYRAEAGANGRDTRGLYRVHEFTKVELFAWTDDVSSNDMLQEILDLQCEIISGLGITAKVLDMPPNELGAPAYRKYDIEAWLPGRGDWGEVTSASNCLDYQSRRLHTKITNENDQKSFAHTLNGTAMAVPRMIIAILENNYNPETKKVEIPTVLRKWMDDKSHIE